MTKTVNITKNLIAVLGEEFVLVDSESKADYEKATFSTNQKVRLIIMPNNLEELKACLEIAEENQVAVYPISRGKNWGNGSRVPTASGCIIVDLKRLNRIVDFDERLAFLTIEAGVTQEQVVQFLEAKKSSLTFGLTGSAKNSSVVGNVLERGDAAGAYGERTEFVCGLQVLLATGEIINTGFKRFSDSKLGSIYSHGLGPSLDGLFCQSNLGIVTQMSIWLEKKPKVCSIVLLSLETSEQLVKVVDKLSELALQRIFLSLTIWNDIKLISCLQQYPYELTDQKTPLPSSVRLQLRKKHDIALWSISVPLFSYSEEQAVANMDIIKAATAPLVNKLEIFPEVSPELAYNHQSLNVLSPYWRKKGSPSGEFELDKEGCGLVWSMNILPFLGEDVASAAQIAEAICLQHGFEANTAIVATGPRALRFLVAIVYDRNLDGEDAQALACFNALSSSLKHSGYLPYRLGIQAMSQMSSDFDDYGEIWRRIKDALDPGSIIAPGRYEFYIQPLKE